MKIAMILTLFLLPMVVFCQQQASADTIKHTFVVKAISKKVICDKIPKHIPVPSADDSVVATKPLHKKELPD